MPIIKRIRDLSLLDLPGEMVLVTACDSLGAIGAKELDVVKVSSYFVGRAAARVPLMEVLAAGAEPVAFYNTLAVEMVPYGEEIIEGMARELVLAGIDPALVLNGSTEENVPTRQTGVGVVAVGLVPQKDLLLGKAQKEDLVIAFGLPKVGPEVAAGGPDDPEVAKPSLVKNLLKWGYVHELLPVGSKGILYECRELAGTAGLVFQLDHKVTLNVKKSAGPATCLLAAVPSETLSLLKNVKWLVPWQVVGRLV
ncbi:hypothetical protein BR63_00335 [Thermanaerosceptrum fracticalcis]|uniref:PurM-like N-terminal domain-containing protein n=1 Tax=Thermanaerosceptrum fracticalcis TaxID=1712410 RepID=A0A7G6DYK4_THEFR|nr:AIR synthase related protein [Thermanaerosceptrum fracticalcis]QNB44908.1 hypothetical protein BR63_00335 [Thermanaerosceptrum fracticalcis]